MFGSGKTVLSVAGNEKKYIRKRVSAEFIPENLGPSLLYRLSERAATETWTGHFCYIPVALKSRKSKSIVLLLGVQRYRVGGGKILNLSSDKKLF